MVLQVGKMVGGKGMMVRVVGIAKTAQVGKKLSTNVNGRRAAGGGPTVAAARSVVFAPVA